MNAGIQSFRQSTDPLLHTSRIEATGHTYEQQTHIGWGDFLKGNISVEWGHLMLNEYQKSTPIDNMNHDNVSKPH